MVLKMQRWIDKQNGGKFLSTNLFDKIDNLILWILLNFCLSLRKFEKKEINKIHNIDSSLERTRQISYNPFYFRNKS